MSEMNSELLLFGTWYQCSPGLPRLRNNEAYSSIDNIASDRCLRVSTGSREHVFSTVPRNGFNQIMGRRINFGVRLGILGICYWTINSTSLGLYIAIYAIKLTILT